LANANRWSLSARQGFLVVTMFAAGLFVLCCGTGMTNIPVAVLGGAVGLLGPVVIVLSSVRANRADVFGSAHVSQSSPPPMTGIYGRADLHVMINAQGIHNAVVRLRDPQVPVSKWPDVGATLPVLIPNGNPRRAQVLWDQVRSHRDDAAYEGRYSRYADEEEYYEYSPTPPAGVDLVDEVPEEEAPGDEVIIDPVSVDAEWRRPANEPAPEDEPALADAPASQEEEAPVPAGVAPTAHAPAVTAAPAAPAPPTSAPGGPLPRRRPSPWPRRQAERTDDPSTSPPSGVNGRGAASAIEAPAGSPTSAEATAEAASADTVAPAEPAPADAAPADVQATVEAAPADRSPAEANPAEQESPAVERERAKPRPSVVPAQPTAAAVKAAEAAAAMVAEAEAQARAEAQAKSPAEPAAESEAREPEPTDTTPAEATPTEATTPEVATEAETAEPEPEAHAEPEAQAEPEAHAEPEAQAQPEAHAEPEAQAQPEVEPPPARPRAIELTITNPALAARDNGHPAPNGQAVEPSPYVASYLADEPEESPPGLGGVHNVSVTLIVADLRRSLTFYRDLLGLTEIDSGVGSAVLASGNARILLRQVADTRPVDRRVVHLNLEVDDVHEAYERLRREGVEFMHPPRVVNQGEQLEQWAATLRDPDGHAIALTRWEVRP
jgi:catechol 2,3-dioxygenase-like lactoylglutathione lyase family enzyme